MSPERPAGYPLPQPERAVRFQTALSAGLARAVVLEEQAQACSGGGRCFRTAANSDCMVTGLDR